MKLTWTRNRKGVHFGYSKPWDPFEYSVAREGSRWRVNHHAQHIGYAGSLERAKDVCQAHNDGDPLPAVAPDVTES